MELLPPLASVAYSATSAPLAAASNAAGTAEAPCDVAAVLQVLINTMNSRAVVTA